jgi:hypothetical protein
MEKTIVFLLLVAGIAGCGKHNAVGPPGVVSGISYYDVSQHRVDIESFAYNGAQLTTYTNQIIDSIAPYGYEMPYAMETVAYRFQYQDTGVEPVAYSVADSFYGPDFTPQTVLVENTYVLRYDGQRRIISDSLTSTTDTSSCCGPTSQWEWDYSAAGFGVDFRFGSRSLVPYDSVLFNEGDVYSYGGPAVVGTVFGSARNPLYDPAYAGNLGPLLFEVGQGGSLAWLPFKVDFLSRNLPVSAGSPAGNDYRITITWQTGSDGRVSGGTVTDMFVPTNTTDSFFGPVKISYRYQ